MCRPKKKDLKGFLDQYKAEAGLSIHWVLMGPSGQETRPPEGGVLRTYQRCNPNPNWIIKTIANMYFVTGVTNHPHNFPYRCAASPLLQTNARLRLPECATSGQCSLC